AWPRPARSGCCVAARERSATAPCRFPARPIPAIALRRPTSRPPPFAVERLLTLPSSLTKVKLLIIFCSPIIFYMQAHGLDQAIPHGAGRGQAGQFFGGGPAGGPDAGGRQPADQDAGKRTWRDAV